MNWAILSILAAFCFAIANIIAKYTVGKLVKNPTTPIIFTGFFGLGASIIVYLFQGYQSSPPFSILLAILAGMLYLSSLIIYLQAIKIEEVSIVTALWFLSPIFVVILSALFLNETFTIKVYIGILLLVFGAILISTKNLKKIKMGKAFWLMVLADLLFAITSLITKYLLNTTNFWTVFSYLRIGAFIAAIPFVLLYFKDLKHSVHLHGKKVIGLLSIREIANVTGLILLTAATAIGYVSLVNAISSIQPLFVLILSIAISAFYPQALEENIHSSAIIRKALAITIMIVGIFLIT